MGMAQLTRHQCIMIMDLWFMRTRLHGLDGWIAAGVCIWTAFNTWVSVAITVTLISTGISQPFDILVKRLLAHNNVQYPMDHLERVYTLCLLSSPRRSVSLT